MSTGLRIFRVDGRQTRLGRILLAGEVVDAEPAPSHELRTLPGWVVSHVTRGSGTYLQGDGRQQVIEPGMVTVVAPGVPHLYGTAPRSRWTELFTVVTGPLTDTLAAAGVLAGNGPCLPRAPLPAPALRAVIAAGQPTATDAEHQLLALADLLVDITAADAPDPCDPIKKACALLTEDLQAPVNLREVAAAVELPYDTFRRRFVAEVGQAPLAYRNQRRLQDAAGLLRMTTMTVRQIARLYGFHDEFHFSRRFRAHFGAPPSAYRRDSR
ncbi:AraC family transcriptional regulator [Streptomyces rubiginosohelvolus]|uniref:helix-turn-helix transcriptional regulator n=1 Tax=Streptomyces rubiginosohelvolus TaxID=67362 RepID=UPI0036D84CE8